MATANRTLIEIRRDTLEEKHTLDADILALRQEAETTSLEALLIAEEKEREAVAARSLYGQALDNEDTLNADIASFLNARRPARVVPAAPAPAADPYKDLKAALKALDDGDDGAALRGYAGVFPNATLAKNAKTFQTHWWPGTVDKAKEALLEWYYDQP